MLNSFLNNHIAPVLILMMKIVKVNCPVLTTISFYKGFEDVLIKFENGEPSNIMCPYYTTDKKFLNGRVEKYRCFKGGANPNRTSPVGKKCIYAQWENIIKINL